MRSLWPAVGMFALVGCATAPAPKMSYQEAFARASLEPVPTSTPAPVAKVQVPKLPVPKVAPKPTSEVKPKPVETGFDWPIRPVEIRSRFGRRLHPVTGDYRYHSGVDLAADRGQKVYAAGAGTVARTGQGGAHGLMVELRHPDGTLTRYSHLGRALVRRGEEVERGEPIGLAGDSGVTTGVHLHFEVWRDGRPKDPAELLGPPPKYGEPLAFVAF